MHFFPEDAKLLSTGPTAIPLSYARKKLDIRRTHYIKADVNFQ